MKFEWDFKKAQINLKKHGISFDFAVTIFNDPLHLSVLDSSSSVEERWLTVGCASDQRTLVVVHLYIDYQNGEELIRIISARRTTKKEKGEYEEGI